MFLKEIIIFQTKQVEGCSRKETHSPQTHIFYFQNNVPIPYYPLYLHVKGNQNIKGHPFNPKNSNK